MLSLSLHEGTWRREGTKGHVGVTAEGSSPMASWPLCGLQHRWQLSAAGPPPGRGGGGIGAPCFTLCLAAPEKPQHRGQPQTSTGTEHGLRKVFPEGGDTGHPSVPRPTGGSSGLPAKGMAREGSDTTQERWSVATYGGSRAGTAGWHGQQEWESWSNSRPHMFLLHVLCPLSPSTIPTRRLHPGRSSVQAGQEAGEGGVTPQDTPPCTFGGWQLGTWGQSWGYSPLSMAGNQASPICFKERNLLFP